MRYLTHKLRFPLSVILIILLVISGCKKDDDKGIPVKQDNVDFYREMKNWYYWNSFIPEVNPSAYSSLERLLAAIIYKDLDRNWSFVRNWDEFWAYLNNSEFIGYGFGHRYDQSGNLRITHIFNTVSMYQQGVRRSWIIRAINGVNITPGTIIGPLLGPDQAGVSNTFRFEKPDGTFTDISVAKASITMNTVLHHEIININDKRIGYMVLSGFLGTTENDLKNVFDSFKQSNINELILDLRYNGGGLTSAARKLASLIVGSQFAGYPFVRYNFNSLKQQENRVENFTNESNSLSINRLVVITTGGTASSSELIINGLKPYMNVITVGARTYGKPVGASVLRFKQKWAMAPITFKTENANNEGDYFNGLPVNIPAGDGLDRMFGDPEELSLKAALGFITAGVTKSDKVVWENPWPAQRDSWTLNSMILTD